MTDGQLALVILGATLGGSLALALRTGRTVQSSGAESVASLASWSIADRRFGTLLIFVLLAGEIYTTFTFLGASGWIYARGAPAYYVFASGTVAYVSSYWLLPAIWRRATTWGVLTQPEFFARAFDSAPLGRLVSVVSLLALLPYLVLQLTGLGIIVSETSFGAMSAQGAVLIGLMVMTVYVVLTGVRGSVYVAALKDVLVLTTVLALAVILPRKLFGGITPMFDQLVLERPALLTFPARGYSGTWYATSVLLTALGFYLWPHTFASIFTARDARTFRRNAVLMPVYQLLLVLVFIIGFAAVLAVPELKGTDADLALLRVVRQTLPPWLVGVVGAAGLLTALVPGSMILITMATIGARLTTSAEDERAKRRAQWLVPVFAGLALLGSWFGGQSLVALLLLAYAVMAQLVPALACALVRPGAVPASAITTGLVVGEGIIALDLLTEEPLLLRLQDAIGELADVNIGIVALLANIMAVVITTMLCARVRRHR